MEYTKGEWLNHDGLIETAYAPNGAVIAEINEVTSHWEANAHLIAAAPDMYKTGLQLLEVMCELCRRLNPQHMICQSCEEIEGYRKAFAKAEGK